MQLAFFTRNTCFWLTRNPTLNFFFGSSQIFTSISLTFVASRRTFKTPRTQQFSKKMAHYGYGWYTQEQLEDYYDQLIGRFLNAINIFRIILEINHLRRLCQDPEAGDLH